MPDRSAELGPRIERLERRPAEHRIARDLLELDAQRLARASQARPHGVLGDVEHARDLAAVMALTEKFAPPLAAPLRQLAGGSKTAKLRAAVSLAQAGAGSATGKLELKKFDNVARKHVVFREAKIK